MVKLKQLKLSKILWIVIKADTLIWPLNTCSSQGYQMRTRNIVRQVMQSYVIFYNENVSFLPHLMNFDEILFWLRYGTIYFLFPSRFSRVSLIRYASYRTKDMAKLSYLFQCNNWCMDNGDRNSTASIVVIFSQRSKPTRNINLHVW